MQEYLVRWEIGVVASSASDAANKARSIQRDPELQSTLFSVTTLNGNLATTEKTIGVDVNKEQDDD